MLSCMSCPGPLRKTAGEVRNLNAAANSWHSCCPAAGVGQKLGKGDTGRHSTNGEMLRLPATPPLSSPTASGKANWQKNRRRGSSGKQFSSFARERKCPRKEKKILRANPRTPGSAISVTAMSRPRPPNTSPGPRPRQLLGDGRADPEMRDWGGDAVRYCVFAWCRRRALPCRLYVASGRASGTRTASRPRVSWSQSKRAAPGTDTDRQPCVPAVSRARADDDRRNELRRERFYFAWRLAPPRKMKKKEKKGRDYSTVIARPV
jgi:hypothetical protein